MFDYFDKWNILCNIWQVGFLLFLCGTSFSGMLDLNNWPCEIGLPIHALSLVLLIHSIIFMDWILGVI